MNPTDTISDRAKAIMESPMRADLEVYFDALENLYHPSKNPQGAFPLNMAENTLGWNLLKSKIQQIQENEIVPDWASKYGNTLGVDSFRETVAQFLSTFLIGCPIQQEHLAFSSGLTSVIDLSVFLLANEGDTAVFPAPAYPVYKNDIGAIPGIKRFDLQTHDTIDELSAGIPLDEKSLRQALKTLEESGERFKILVLTHPDNPTGAVYSDKQLTLIADWCIDHRIHLVVNEIYGCSLIDTNHPAIAGDYPAQVSFRSFGNIMAAYKSPYLHLWYSFSKDFGISGFRVGLVHSYNEAFLNAYANANLTHSVSNYTQWILQCLLEDHDFIADYLRQYQKELTACYVMVVELLKKHQIPYVPSRGSLFVWIDLSDWLEENTDIGQEALWLDIYHATGVLLTPGEGFGHRQKGHFRLVISYHIPSHLRVALQRLDDYLQKTVRTKD
ncbi:aminotransferase class I/II-fold pyridoxal phosphate-dependent enzyme [Echinicola vietnamensis]|uniref:Aminotransferase n=1 Tax=Echinicola vietnamensis (strain DSM 17526 / LMG 23754 / KMM 6221) TaxID=926556 RepID=L0G7C5_ECHVK|nr:aminotransferase class I/II-fold pyridoxal phosphate-dependent enzyme [Echinicola vietnamensis]AGA80755.1 aspartate/tyrosine/aromatic aminotransferase [Echinicola vietnamensis DSM 17526]